MNDLRVQLAFLAPAIVDFALAGLQGLALMSGAGESFLPRALVGAIAFSWGVLLLIALREPQARAWVLAPTILVETLIGLAVAAAYLHGAIGAPGAAAALFVSCVLVGLTWAGLARLRASLPR